MDLPLLSFLALACISGRMNDRDRNKNKTDKNSKNSTGKNSNHDDDDNSNNHNNIVQILASTTVILIARP